MSQSEPTSELQLWLRTTPRQAGNVALSVFIEFADNFSDDPKPCNNVEVELNRRQEQWIRQNRTR